MNKNILGFITIVLTFMMQPTFAAMYNIQLNYEGFFYLDLDISSNDPANTSTIVNNTDWVITRFYIMDDELHPSQYVPVTVSEPIIFSLDTTYFDGVYYAPLPIAGYLTGSFSTDYDNYIFENDHIRSTFGTHELSFSIPLAVGIATLIEPPIPAPLPGAIWLLGSGLIGLAGVARRKKA